MLDVNANSHPATLTLDRGSRGVRVTLGYVQATEYYCNPANGSDVIAITKVQRTHEQTNAISPIRYARG